MLFVISSLVSACKFSGSSAILVIHQSFIPKNSRIVIIVIVYAFFLINAIMKLI